MYDTSYWSGMLTISARLYRSLDIPDALDSDPVLVVSVDVLVLKFADLVKQDTKLVGHVGNVLVAGLAPYGKLLLERRNSALDCAF